MDGQLKKFRHSFHTDRCVLKLQTYCRFSSVIMKVPIIPKPLCVESNCHNNVNLYVNNYGGTRISGYYLITDIGDDSCGCAIYHSIWKNTYGDLIDITPHKDGRAYNMFTVMNENNYYSGVFYDDNKFRILNSEIINI